MVNSVSHVLGNMMRIPCETSVTFFSTICSLFSREVKSLRIIFFKLSHMKHTRLHGAGKPYVIFFKDSERSWRGGRHPWGLHRYPVGTWWVSRERMGRRLASTWGRGGRWRIGAGGHNRKPRQPTCVPCSPCQPLVLDSFVEAGSVCSQDLLNCWLVCEFSKALAHVFFSVSTEHIGSTHKKSDSFRTCSPSVSPGSWLCLWTVSGVLISARLFSMFLSASQQCIFAEIFFFLTILQTCEILPQFFTQSGKFKYSSLIFEDTDSQFRTLKSSNLKSRKKFSSKKRNPLIRLSGHLSLPTSLHPLRKDATRVNYHCFVLTLEFSCCHLNSLRMCMLIILHWGACPEELSFFCKWKKIIPLLQRPLQWWFNLNENNNTNRYHFWLPLWARHFMNAAFIPTASLPAISTIPILKNRKASSRLRELIKLKQLMCDGVGIWTQLSLNPNLMIFISVFL